VFSHNRLSIGRLAVAVGSAAALLVAGISAGGAGASGGSITLVAYSTPATAYGQIISAFGKTSAGQGISFSQSYGASGDQARAVADGLHADVVNLSLQPDIGILVNAGLVKANWYKNSHHGFVTNSLVVFDVRKGNPKHIHTWADLVKSGVDVINPNPFSSGGARWNVMAAYGAQIMQKKTKKQALAYLQNLYSHISVQDTSAAKSMATFNSGKGDVLIGYESEALAAQKAGANFDIVIPPQTILIENPVAVTTDASDAKVTNAFVNFLYGKTAQTIFAQNGYRSVIPAVAKKFKTTKPKTLFTIRKLGGWPAIQRQFFDPTTGYLVKIEHNKSS
jgi:sulfate transport system substrate-binding protein